MRTARSRMAVAPQPARPRKVTRGSGGTGHAPARSTAARAADRSAGRVAAARHGCVRSAPPAPLPRGRAAARRQGVPAAAPTPRPVDARPARPGPSPEPADSAPRLPRSPALRSAIRALRTGAPPAPALRSATGGDGWFARGLKPAAWRRSDAPRDVDPLALGGAQHLDQRKCALSEADRRPAFALAAAGALVELAALRIAPQLLLFLCHSRSQAIERFGKFVGADDSAFEIVFTDDLQQAARRFGKHEDLAGRLGSEHHRPHS